MPFAINITEVDVVKNQPQQDIQQNMTFRVGVTLSRAVPGKDSGRQGLKADIATKKSTSEVTSCLW
jgi:hypothetical protein